MSGSKRHQFVAELVAEDHRVTHSELDLVRRWPAEQSATARPASSTPCAG
jgi:hypothetical protein